MNDKFDKIYELIEKYENIVIARHVGVDPDALCSQLGLKYSILETFPNKKVYAVGSGSSKFLYIGKLDKMPENLDNTLLIVTDTPDIKRIDGIGDVTSFSDSIKLDHHPFMEEFCTVECINDNLSSASELVLDMLYYKNMVINYDIARILYIGIVSDTGRFMFSNSKSSTFEMSAKLMNDFNLDLTKIYEDIYLRPLQDIRLQGYISLNMVETENKVGYMKLTNDDLLKFNADTSSAGNMVNNFNFIEEFVVWLTLTEDIKNNFIKVNIRSRGPVINKIAEKYNGGGHAFASGARVYSWEEADKLIEELDLECKKYLEGETSENN